MGENQIRREGEVKEVRKDWTAGEGEGNQWERGHDGRHLAFRRW